MILILVGVGIYFFVFRKTDESGEDNTTDEGEEDVTLEELYDSDALKKAQDLNNRDGIPPPYTCKGFFLGNQKKCKTSKEAGIAWDWDTSDEDLTGLRCAIATKTYDVTFNSDFDSDNTFKAVLPSGKRSIGIKELGSYTNNNVKFTITPKTNDGLNVIGVPEVINFTTDATPCSTAGIVSEAPVPTWDKNNNIKRVRVKNSHPAVSNMVVTSMLDNRDIMTTGSYPVGQSNSVYVPQGGQFKVRCGNYQRTRGFSEYCPDQNYVDAQTAQCYSNQSPQINTPQCKTLE